MTANLPARLHPDKGRGPKARNPWDGPAAAWKELAAPGRKTWQGLAREGLSLIDAAVVKRVRAAAMS
jgi:hypothetical protein